MINESTKNVSAFELGQGIVSLNHTNFSETHLMDFEQIKELVKRGESHTLEFKTSMTQLKGAFETLCGFLNAHGGTVIIGVSDSGKIIGQEVIDKTRRAIAHEIKKIEPSAHILVDYVPVSDHKKLIILQTQEREYAPYVYDGKPHLRNQSTTSEMTQVQYKQLMVKNGQLKYAWDEQPADKYTVEDLDQEEIRQAIRQAVNTGRLSEFALSETIPDILKRLQLLIDDHLTNAAAILFAEDARKGYPQCHIMMARFRGLTKLDPFMDNQGFYGNAFRILSEASNFIARHLPIASHFEQDSFVRVDKPALPVLAVREALINAITHRDYTSRTSHIALAIYDDRLEIWSYGRLPPQLTIPELSQSHQSYPRNKHIAEMFYLRGFVEKWGRGTNKIIDDCRDEGIPLPEFAEYTGGFSITFKFKEPISPTAIVKSLSSSLSAKQQKIFDVVKDHGPLTFQRLQELLKHTIPERTLRRELQNLTNNGILRVQGETTARVWFVAEK